MLLTLSLSAVEEEFSHRLPTAHEQEQGINSLFLSPVHENVTNCDNGREAARCRATNQLRINHNSELQPFAVLIYNYIYSSCGCKAALWMEMLVCLSVIEPAALIQIDHCCIDW